MAKKPLSAQQLEKKQLKIQKEIARLEKEKAKPRKRNGGNGKRPFYTKEGKTQRHDGGRQCQAKRKHCQTVILQIVFPF